MNKRWLLLLLSVCVMILILLAFNRKPDSQYSVTAVEKGRMTITLSYEGELQSRQIENIMSTYGGSATISYIVPEGQSVNKGDLLVQFDTSEIEKDLLLYQKEYDMADLELQRLTKVDIPMKEKSLELALAESKTQYADEIKYTKEIKELLKEDLVSQHEIEEQERKLQKSLKKLETDELNLKLTKEHLHPIKIDMARAELQSAKNKLKMGKEQLTSCSIKSPTDGLVVYRPIQISTEYRPVRVGDSVYQNQTFMLIPDMSNLIAQCYVPEADMGSLQPGSPVTVTPIAYPDLHLQGRVSSISQMAQTAPWLPQWKKYFRLSVSLTDHDPRCKAGMSAYIQVLAYHAEDVLLIPRSAVFWEDGKPFCMIPSAIGNSSRRELTLGKANETHYEIIAGIKETDKILRK